MNDFLKNKEQVVELIRKLTNAIEEEDMNGYDILIALCFVKADVVVKTTENFDAEKEARMLEYFERVTIEAIKLIREAYAENNEEV
jgi:hypothetical protein